MYPIDLKKAKSQLDDLIKIARDGEEVILMENDEPVLKLVRVTSSWEIGLRGVGMPRRQSGSAKGLISMSDDFDAPLEDFDEYLR